MKWFIEMIMELFKKKKKKEKEKPTPECEWSHSGRRSVLIKPHAEGDGNLVVLLPSAYCPHDIDRVVVAGEVAWKVYKTDDPDKIILNPDGTKSGPNENATHCRFKQPGEKYGGHCGDAYLSVYLKSGEIRRGLYNMGIKDSYEFPKP